MCTNTEFGRDASVLISNSDVMLVCTNTQIGRDASVQ